MFLARVLREILGSEKGEMKGDRRKLHNEEFQQLAGSCEHCNELILPYSFRELSYMSIMKQQICFITYIYIILYFLLHVSAVDRHVHGVTPVLKTRRSIAHFLCKCIVL